MRYQLTFRYNNDHAYQIAELIGYHVQQSLDYCNLLWPSVGGDLDPEDRPDLVVEVDYQTVMDTVNLEGRLRTVEGPIILESPPVMHVKDSRQSCRNFSVKLLGDPQVTYADKDSIAKIISKVTINLLHLAEAVA